MSNSGTIVLLALVAAFTFHWMGCGDGDSNKGAGIGEDSDSHFDTDMGAENCVCESGTVYYVAPDGAGGNRGTIDAPFASLQEAHDHEALQPGDVICLRGGTYYPADRTLFQKVGKPDAYLRVESYPGELPVIDGEKIPEGDIEGGSTATWAFMDAAYWKVKGPIRLTNGRGAGVYVEDSRYLEFEQVDSSYNGKRAARAGHGFFLWGSANDHIAFLNCDSHHNANHLWKSGEDQVVNQYQHGDGWRIFAGTNITLEGCRAWHNLDDGYDFTQAPDPVRMTACWAAYSGIDDADGSITGISNQPMSRWEGDGIKLGYEDDIGQHEAVRCLSWNNHCHGWNVHGGPYTIFNSASFNNAEDAFFGVDQNGSNVRQNTYGFQNSSGNGAGAEDYSGITVSDTDFLSLEDEGMLGPREPGGGLPRPEFLKLDPASNLVDKGIDVDIPYKGDAPDIGPFESSGD